MAMTDLESALRKIVTDVVREELHTALTQLFNKHGTDAGRRYVSAVQAASIAAVSPGAIRAWIREGRLREYRAGRVLRISIDELHAFLEAKPLEPESQHTPEELAHLAVERMIQVNMTRCPECQHLSRWHFHDGCRAKNCKCRRRMP